MTDPRLRATLQEIIAHPWMTKGFPGPVENYLPPREPLTLPLDRNVILAMTGFDFGSPDSIERNLTEVLEREEYKNAVKAYYRERAGHGLGNDRRKMFGAFDFYKRRSSVSGKEQVSGQTGETMPLGQDPTNAFHPLISIYYLVREKQERDALEELPGALEIPHSPDEAPIPLPDLPAPPPVHTNTSTYEMPGEAPTGGRSRARARTHGEDEMDEVTNKGYAPGGSPMPPASPNIEAQPAKKENAAVGLLRRFSTRKSRDPDRERHGRPTAPSVTVQTTERSRSRVDQGPSKSLSIRRTRDRTNPPVSRQWPIDASPVRGDLLSPQDAATGGLHRSSSINDAESRRQQVSRATSEGPPSATLPLTSSSDRAMVTDQQELGTSTPPVTGTQRRHTKSYSTTIRTKSLGHARRESIQARRAQMVEARNADAAPEDAAAQQDEPHGEGRELAAEQAKPVYLKGLFSVQTTSTKPVSVIRVDIIRVLNQLSIPYLEMRGGFSCQQRPSIRLPLEPSSASAELIPPKAGSHRRKISFGGLKGAASNSNSNGKDAEKAEDLLDLQRSPKPSFFGSVAVPAGRRPQDNSFTGSDNSNESIDRKMTANNPTTTTTKKHQQQQQQPADGIQGRAAPGEETMTLNFEINIVKVPLLSLHGIQFKRVGGDTWTYKEMASKILRELRL